MGEGEEVKKEGRRRARGDGGIRDKEQERERGQGVREGEGVKNEGGRRGKVWGREAKSWRARRGKE